MKVRLVLLAVMVAVAGCTMFDGGDRREKPKVVEVESLECRVGGSSCASLELTKFDGPANIRLVVGNYGEAPVKFDVGEDGRHIMVSKCNNELAEISEFSAEIRGPRGIETVEDNLDAVEVNEDERLIVEWTLDLVPEDEGTVSDLGYQCPMDFRLEFAQVLRSSRQIQIRADEDVPVVRDLDFVTSSKQPVKLLIESPDSFVPQQETDKRLVVRSFLRNEGPGEIEEIEYVRPFGDDSEVYETCDPEEDQIRMYSVGERAGESYRRVCTILSSSDFMMLDSDSEVNRLRFEAEYRYSMSLNSQRLVFIPVE